MCFTTFSENNHKWMMFPICQKTMVIYQPISCSGSNPLRIFSSTRSRCIQTRSGMRCGNPNLGRQRVPQLFEKLFYLTRLCSRDLIVNCLRLPPRGLHQALPVSAHPHPPSSLLQPLLYAQSPIRGFWCPFHRDFPPLQDVVVVMEVPSDIPPHSTTRRRNEWGKVAASDLTNLSSPRSQLFARCLDQLHILMTTGRLEGRKWNPLPLIDAEGCWIRATMANSGVGSSPTPSPHFSSFLPSLPFGALSLCFSFFFLKRAGELLLY